jgi:hypothetical protein
MGLIIEQLQWSQQASTTCQAVLNNTLEGNSRSKQCRKRPSSNYKLPPLHSGCCGGRFLMAVG